MRKCWAAMHEAEAAMAKAEKGVTTARVDAAAVVAAIAVADADDVLPPPNTVSLRAPPTPTRSTRSRT